MFDQLKSMGAIADLLKNQGKIKEAAERVKNELEALEVIGEAGGGIAKVVSTGTLKVVRTDIAPALASGLSSDDPEQRRLANQMIAEAVNDALTRSQHAARAAIEREAQALGIPGLAEKLTELLPGFDNRALP